MQYMLIIKIKLQVNFTSKHSYWVHIVFTENYLEQQWTMLDNAKHYQTILNDMGQNLAKSTKVYALPNRLAERLGD